MHKITNLAYRPDIDGLRAIAVISVVLFHINKSFIPGGYAGVDIFFVISGYLITFLIYGQMHSGTFSFTDFYQRRINRIAPALFTLIAGVSTIGLVILAPADLVRLLKSAVYAALGTSNVFFWREYGNYFSSGVDEAPLLHTWSLGVEEQFYVIWPVVLLLLLRLKPKNRLVTLGMSVLAAVIVSEFGIHNAASASYYLLPTRIFELLIGSSLAVFIFHRGAPFGRIASNTIGITGLSLTLGSLFLLTSASQFPGINAIYPCAGVALLIASGTDKNAWAARVLALKPFVFVGLISYSLYLWHWPLIAFANYLGINVSPAVGAIIFCASIFMAWLSWRFIETPFRRSGNGMSFRSTSALRYAAPLAAVLLVSFAASKTGGFPSRVDAQIVAYERIISTAPNELRADCHSPTFYYDRKPSSSCVLGTVGKPAEALLIGDSFANHFTGMVDVLAKNDNVSVTDYTMDGCMPVKGMGFGSLASYAEKCKMRNNFSYDFIAKNKYKYVILAGSWPSEGTDEFFTKLQEGMVNSIASILSSGAKPIIILNSYGTANANCPIRRLLHGGSESCDKKREPRDRQMEMFSALKKTFPQLTYIDPNEAMCDKITCHSMIGAIPLYRDAEHLNDIGSRVIGKILVEKGVHFSD